MAENNCQSLPPYLGGSLPAGADETFVRALITEASAASSVEASETHQSRIMKTKSKSMTGGTNAIGEKTVL